MGSTFKTELETHLVDYSAVEAYDFSLMYNEDDLVSFEGVFYICIESAAVNQSPPLYTKWKVAPKFDLACIDDFWCTFLGEYLSLSVILGRLPEIRTQVTAEGTIQRISDTYNPASNEAYHQLYGSYLGRKDMIFANLVKFVKAQIKVGTTPCLELFNYLKFIGTNCCSGCGECFDECSCDNDFLDSRMLYEVG